MHLFLLASLGGAIGAGARHLCNVGAMRLFGPGFPWSTLTVNVVGSAAMGALLTVIALRLGGSNEWRTFLLTGILGGFTTFSAFSMDAVQLWERGALDLSMLYVVASVVASIVAFLAGAAVARYVF